ncbi:MAG TPA: helix-turn-helix transcriptional regulator [Candidatus Dormibacteraeota bacterium]|nr:helix-turn-helix transcriptional regulator [Candidatus Dormibacteraeota bacterium]
MVKHIKKPIRPLRLDGLPTDMRRQLKEVRLARGLTQAELGEQLGIPQMHVSGIESGKIVPRYDTLLDVVRALDHDLVMVPRALVPAVQALIRDHRRPYERRDDDERPLYAAEDEESEGLERSRNEF